METSVRINHISHIYLTVEPELESHTKHGVMMGAEGQGVSVGGGQERESELRIYICLMVEACVAHIAVRFDVCDVCELCNVLEKRPISIMICV